MPQTGSAAAPCARHAVTHDATVLLRGSLVGGEDSVSEAVVQSASCTMLQDATSGAIGAVRDYCPEGVHATWEVGVWHEPWRQTPGEPCPAQASDEER